MLSDICFVERQELVPLRLLTKGRSASLRERGVPRVVQRYSSTTALPDARTATTMNHREH
jgi:hypothetical protein